MKIERDQVRILSGVRWAATLGSPITLQIANRDWENWKSTMAVGAPEPGAAAKQVTRPRPGHADLAGAMKYGHRDIRNVLERSSARETTARVAVAGVAKRLLAEFGVTILSHITQIGGVRIAADLDVTWDELARRAEASEVRCADPAAAAAMIAAIDAAKEKGDTLGGVFEVVALGCPVGLGSYVQWDRRLDGRLAQAFCSIQAIKGCELGLGFETARRPGSAVHDEILFDAESGFKRKTNNAGGLEGGVTNGQPVVVRGVMIIPVNLGSRSYRIIVESGALDTVGARLAELRVGSRTALVSDAAILRLYGKAVARSLESAGFTVTTVEVPAGEAAKTLGVAERCWDALLAAGLDRTSTVLALGGGAVGDVAGFVAATYMRGVNIVQLPTTVLAMVDASSGGKTAINHPTAKNLIGAFHQPRLVLCDPTTTRTLSQREFSSGLAEIVKHGIVLDAAYFAEVERDAAALCARDLPVVERIIGGSCRLKAGIVERDERESELRHVLNYGHTIGHALEAVTGYARFAHGEAVALGIVAEARLARRLGIGSDETVARQERLLASVGLPVRAPAIDADEVLAAITRDKKARDGRVPFVLAPRIGAFQLAYDVSPDLIRAALRELGP